MAGSRANIDPIGEVAARVVADDPVIRERVKRIVEALLDDAEHTIRWGAPRERAALMKQVVPSLLRSMRGADASAQEQQQLDAYERIKAGLRGSVNADPDNSPEGG